MKSSQWEELWWAEFKRLRHEYPTKDLLVLQKAATTYMNKRYGARPPDEPGPPWWMQMGAFALGVPMGFLGKLWEYMNGKKTLFGAILTALTVVATQLGVLLPLFGVDAVVVAKILGVVTFVVGLGHKLYKFLYKEEHP